MHYRSKARCPIPKSGPCPGTSGSRTVRYLILSRPVGGSCTTTRSLSVQELPVLPLLTRFRLYQGRMANLFEFQPGGVIALRSLGLEACLEKMDVTLMDGYHIYDSGQSVHFPFPNGYQGRSFRHGRFVMNLREAAIKAKGVEVIEATVSGLLENADRVIGVRATRRKRPCKPSLEEPLATDASSDESFFADLVFIADGCFSHFRTAILGSKSKSQTISHFVGTVLEDVMLPYPNHGMVALVHGSGPVLLYQIGQKDIRMLVDLKIPLPKDLKVIICAHVTAFLTLTAFRRIS